MKKQIYVILTVLLFNSCTLREEKKCHPKFKIGNIIKFKSDTTITGVVINNTEWCGLYQVSYFDKHGVNRVFKFNENEIISKKNN